MNAIMIPFTSRLAIAAALVLVGCASTSPGPAFKDVAQATRDRGAPNVRWDQNTVEDGEAAQAINALLSKDLTVDGAVQVALLANPRLRSTFEELSISQAELVQAGLLKNPVFSLGITAWEQEHISPNLFATVEQDFLDIVTMPMRKRVAATELEATKLEVGDAVLKLAAEARAAYFTAQAAEQVAKMRRLIHEAAETSAELARRQYEAGNTNDLTLNSELGLASQARLDLSRSEGEAAVAREHLNKLMGLWGTRTGWKLAPRLPELPAEEVALDRLESIAVEKRLDVNAARRELQALDYALSLVKTTRWTGVVNVSVEAGRLRDSRRISFGPSVALEIPLFDQRQAAVARLAAFKRQAENHLQALAVEARSDVRASKVRLTTARTIVEEYGRGLVPLRENIVKFSQEQYDAMLLGVYQLIQAKQNEFLAYREYIEALRDYWIAKSDLERAIGTRLLPGAIRRPENPSDRGGSALPVSPEKAPALPAPPPGSHQHRRGE
jgi:cobalt-zinc-cadmium efflux system outer membrane protein